MWQDEILKWRLRRGHSEALARVYARYVDTMLTVAMGLLNNAAEAEDVVQDVFVSLARSAEGLTPQGRLKAYLMTAVVNQVRDRIRRQRRRPAQTCDAIEVVTPARGPDEELVFSEETARLSVALTMLPDEQRETIMLKLKGDLKFREIARLQGVSINTVQGRYRYGLQKLRTALNGEVQR